ncbi:MAG: excinuclease ABC subunit UvrC [Promicromonosporaceae bacterium]|nr:excinuclease ABC subunit UvrC [Promicromonosporaceae bacterium]
MADPATYRPPAGQIPTDPGVYRFSDQHGRVIYVGKAKNLRARLSSYFQDVAALHPRTQTMVTTAARVEWTVVGTEVEALALEYSWIKEYEPRFNVKYRDDKSYPYLAVTMGEEFPRAQVMRGAKRPGTRYFGPYGQAWAIRDTLDLLLRVFPIRTCSAGVFRRAQQQDRPCLQGYIDRCAAPCVGRVSAAEHRELAAEFCQFMAGQTGQFVRRLDEEMQAASAALDFEAAARLRDQLVALRAALEKNTVVLPDATDADVFGLAGDDLEAAVQVFHVRGGRITGQRGWVVEKVEDLTDADLVEHLLQQVYGDEGREPELRTGGDDRGEGSAVPREILVPTLPANPPQVRAWLTGLRGAAVTLKVPQRGDKRALAETVTKNAQQALVLHRTRRAGDLTTRSQALSELQAALGLAEAPLRIECYDVSHTQTTYRTASMVVFEDGLPRKSEYRTFKIQSLAGGFEHGGADASDGNRDDSAAMFEVITRRFRRYLTDAERYGDLDGELGDEAPGKRRFAYPPQLVIVDGGIPQVNAARRALDELGITDVPLCGLAKKFEEIYLPGRRTPIVLERTSEGLYLMQRLRDEAHRFAITTMRKARSKGMTASALDDIPGLGPIRSKELLRHFGSLKRLKLAGVDEIAAARGIGPALARTVYGALHPAQPAGEMAE